MKDRSSYRSIGAFEAKTRLAELLRDAENGVTYAIRRRGKIVGQLGPASGRLNEASVEALKRDIADFRGRVRKKFTHKEIKEMVESGRR